MLGRAGVALAVGVALAACAGRGHQEASPRHATVSAAELVSEPDEYKDRPISAAAGELYFNETGVGDPYAAGIPYPVFLAMMRAYPAQLGESWAAFSTRFGAIPTSSDPFAPPIGFHLTVDPNTHVPFVVNNCALCHAGRLRTPNGEQVILGLGSTRIRVHAYDAALTRIALDPSFTLERMLPFADDEARARHVVWPVSMRSAFVAATIRNMRARAEARREGVERLAAGLPGRVATIESFVLALNAARAVTPDVPWHDVPLRADRPIGWAKVPDVVGARYRDTLSWDGVGTGSPAALAAEADFVFGVRPVWFDTHRHIGTSLYLFLRGFERALPFPGSIDASLAARGKVLFGQKCARCHGTHDAGGVVYRERVVPIDWVGTDRARLEAVTPELVAAANAVPLTRGLTHVAATGGYVPPPLLDVWARAPYGHVGQWPSLRVMATLPDARPRRFVVEPSAEYDLESVGIRTRAAGEPLSGDAYVYDADNPGYDVRGHPFLAELGTEAAAVIEYLKGL